MPHLDTLRAFAVCGVLYHHFSTPLRSPLGPLRVTLFFVMSGFLITGILLRARERGDLPQQLRRFYFRRALRILPILYLTLAAAALLNLGDLRTTLPWHLGLIANWYYGLRGHWPAPSAHLWTLAVEEQFYMVWPCVILFLPRRALAPAILCAIATAFAFRAFAIGLGPMMVRYMVPSSLDALGLGALLALFRHAKPERFAALARNRVYALAGAVAFTGTVGYVCLVRHGLPANIPGWFPAALFFGWVVHKAAVGFRSPLLKAIFEVRPLMFIGQISYGIYVYHMFVAKALVVYSPRLGVAFPELGMTRTAILFAVTITLAIASWHLLERPLLSLRDRFVPAPAGGGGTAPEVRGSLAVTTAVPVV